MEYNYHKNAGQLAFIKFVKSLVHLLIRPKVEWKDKNLKKSLKDKPVVFVCNHTHHFDGVVISSVLSRYKPYMLVKKSRYDKSGTGSFIRICRSIPVDFDTMDTNWYAQSEGAVENGYSMLIFPEGGIAREGEMLPFKPGAALLESVRASCTVPILYQISEFEGGKYVDGSIADAVPFDRAFEQGCSRVLVLLTKPENEPCTDYRKFEFLINKKYKDYPNLINALMTRFDRYNEQYKRMKQLEEDGILMVLRPSHKYVKSFEMNTDVLDEAYNAGKNLAKERLAEIEDFLNVLEKK